MKADIPTKTIDKFTQLRHIDWVWEPRWHDKKILIMKRKVSKTGNFSFKFQKCPSYPDTYYIEGKDLRRSKVEHIKDKGGYYNECYTYPLEKLKILERTENSMLELN